MNRSLRFHARVVAGGGLLTLAFVAPSLAAGWQPTPLPFSEAHVQRMAVAPNQSGRVYIGVPNIGVFRTDDRGATWNQVNSGLPVDAGIDALVVSPVDPNRAWVALHAPAVGFGSVWRTTNAGSTWISSPGIPGGNISDLLVVSTNPTILLASLQSGGSSSIYRSTDDGATWNPAGVGLSEVVNDLDSRVADPNLVLAATGNGVARSTDSGTTWTPGVPGQATTRVVLAPSDGSRAYAARSNWTNTFLGSTNGGASFFSIDAPAGFDRVDHVAVHPTFPGRLMAAGRGYGCQGFYDFLRIEQSTNAGQSWSPGFYECPSAPPSDLFYDAVDPSHLYLSRDTAAGFSHSASGGAPGTWITKVGGIQNFSIDALEGDLSGTNFVGGSRELYRSDGDLTSWSFVSSTGLLSIPDRFEVNLSNPMRMYECGSYISGDLGFFYLHRSTDAGVNWEPVGSAPDGIPQDAQVLGVFSNHGDGNVVYASVGGGSNGLFRSVNGGVTYAQVNSELLFFLVVDPTDANRIFASGAAPTVRMSTDGGITFEPRSAGLPAGAMRALFMRRSDPDYLVVVYETGEVWETFDAGLAWSLRFDLVVPNTIFEDVADVDWDEASGHVFIATAGFSSTAMGVVSSHPLYDPTGLPSNRVGAVHWDVAQSTLLAGAFFGGLWQQTLGSPVDAPLLANAAAFAIEVAPNPAREATSLRFAVPSGGAQVKADVFDASGRRIRRLVDGVLPAGDRRLVWDGAADSGARASAGVYFVRVRAGDEESTARVVRLR